MQWVESIARPGRGGLGIPKPLAPPWMGKGGRTNGGRVRRKRGREEENQEGAMEKRQKGGQQADG